MRILVVGGTWFVGRHLVAAAVERGHEVTVLHRGIDCSGAPHTRHLHADRDGDLAVLRTGEWDATVDTSAYYPRQVTALADALGERGGRPLLISTVSVYGELAEPGLDEQAPLLAPLGLDGDDPAVQPQTYGRLKVGCELVAQERYAGELLVVRPTFVIGPYDFTGRFPSWVARLARGGEVLVPGLPEAPIQYVDARDLGAFCVSLLEAGEDGTFHTMAPPPTSWGQLLGEIAAAVAPAETALTWAGSDWLLAHGVGPADLPLWTGSDRPEFALAMDPTRALDAGLRTRPLIDTVVDVDEWLRRPGGAAGMRRLGLAPDREAELLAAWRSAH